MICPKCGKLLPDNINSIMTFCPVCGEKLFELGRKYLIEIHCSGQRDDENTSMLVFVDDKHLYEVKPGDSICFAVEAGVHSLKFRYKIRSKTITVLATSSYAINTFYNTLSGLIETIVKVVDDSEDGLNAEKLAETELTAPVMISEDGRKSFDILMGEDEPEYVIKATSGFKTGILRLFTERMEFSSSADIRKDITYYKDVAGVKKKMGAIDVQCEGNVHKVYSIPKDIYNEVMAYLNNKISEVQKKN
ncbi:MAG: zinc ribbon domain-containing protein [Butyrivibrio sp.]|nr:zinc ribbon domain-containing protein [Butyrivibrio sp.]